MLDAESGKDVSTHSSGEVIPGSASGEVGWEGKEAHTGCVSTLAILVLQKHNPLGIPRDYKTHFRVIAIKRQDSRSIFHQFLPMNV